MSRKYFDGSLYCKAREKLPSPDGIHCIYCGGKLPKGRRTKCSDECFSKFYSEHSPNNWGTIKEKVLKRDRYICQECGIAEIRPRRYERLEAHNARNPMLDVHHIKPICEGGLEFDQENCITLCHECHLLKHNKIGRMQRTNKSLEEFK